MGHDRRILLIVSGALGGGGILLVLARSPVGGVLAFYIFSALLVLLLGLGCVGVGSSALRFWEVGGDSLQRLALSFCLGEGILGLLFLAAGLAGLMGFVHLPLLVLAAALGFFRMREIRVQLRREIKNSTRPGEAALGWIAGAGGIALLAMSVVPAFEYDVLGYHLALPKQWVQAGRIAWTPENVFGAFPLLTEMFFYFGLLCGQDLFANMWVALNVLVLAWVIASESRDGEGAIGWAGPAALLSSPLVLTCGASAYNDMPLALFCLMGFVWLNRAVEAKDARLARVAGMLCGFAMGIKYHGFLFGWFLSAICIGLSHRRRAPWAVLVRFSLWAWLFASPWLIRNLLWTGNPFFPLWAGQLGGGMSDAHIAAFSRAHAPTSFSLGSIKGALHDAFLSLGIPLTLLPGLIWARRRGDASFGWPSLSAALACGLMWLFCTNRVDRFLAFSLALCLLFLAQEMQRVSGSWPWVRRLLAALCVVDLFCFLSIAEGLQLFKVAAGAESREAFLDQHVQCHAMAMAMERLNPAPKKVLLVGEARTYPFSVEVTTSYPFSTPPVVKAMEGAFSPEDLCRNLKREGFTHVLVNISSAQRLAEGYDYFHPHDRLWEEPLFVRFLSDCCSLVLAEESKDLCVYALKE